MSNAENPKSFTNQPAKHLKRRDITLFQQVFPSPLGPIQAIASQNGLCFLGFQGLEEETDFLKAFLKKHYPAAELHFKSNTYLNKTKLWLKNYFKKQFKQLSPPALDLQGTLFSIRTLKILQKVQPGKTKSYGALAEAIGKPLAARAIGRTMNQNPIALILPCHRIIGKSGALTGYRGGLRSKKWLLQHERL